MYEEDERLKRIAKVAAEELEVCKFIDLSAAPTHYHITYEYEGKPCEYDDYALFAVMVRPDEEVKNHFVQEFLKHSAD